MTVRLFDAFVDLGRGAEIVCCNDQPLHAVPAQFY
jgi:hypothetical protein